MRKIIAMIAIMMAAVAGFAQATDDYMLPQGFVFTNEIGSDVVNVTGNAHNDYIDSNYRSEFAGIYDKITVKYNSEKLSFELAPKFGIKDVNENYYSKNTSNGALGHGSNVSYNRLRADANGTLNSDDLAFNYWGFDWGLRFTPFDIVDFYLNDGPDIIGSRLPARGKNWGASSLGSDGFAIVMKPIDSLRISGAIPFGFTFASDPNFLNAEVEDSWVSELTTNSRASNYKFRVDVGADYSLGMFGVGAKVNNLINAGARQYGVYAGANAGALTANLGFNYAEDYQNFLDAFDDGLIYIGGKQAVAGGVEYSIGDLYAAIDAMYNLEPAQSVYDLYAGAKVAYDVIPGKFNADVLFGVAADLGTNAHHGTDEDVADLTYAMKTINADFIDLYYSHVALEDLRAATYNGKAVSGVAASQNWQYYTALARTMSNGQIDTTSASKAAIATRIRPGFTYNTGKNEFGAHVNLVNFFDGDGSYQVKFPVYWKWLF